MKYLPAIAALSAVLLFFTGIYSNSQAPLDIGRILFCASVLGWLTMVIRDTVTDIRLPLH